MCDVKREVKVNSPPFNQASLLVVCGLQIFSTNNTECGRLLEEIKCAHCSPNAQVLFHSLDMDKMPHREPDLPRLCQDFCREFYYTCRGHIPGNYTDNNDHGCNLNYSSCAVTWWQQANMHMNGGSRRTLYFLITVCRTFWNETDTCDWEKWNFTSGFIFHWDSACTCRTGRFLDLCKKWCVSSLVCEYLFIQLLPHLTSPPFVAELVSPACFCSLPRSLLYCCTFNVSVNFPAFTDTAAVCWLDCQLIQHILLSKQVEQHLCLLSCSIQSSCVYGTWCRKFCSLVSVGFVWIMEVYFKQHKLANISLFENLECSNNTQIWGISWRVDGKY